MRLVLALLVWFLRAIAKSHPDLVLENLALRQQLSTYARGRKHPQLKPHDRKFWVALSRAWAGWRTPLLMRYYNGARHSQATHAIPAPYPELQTPPTTGRMIALPVLGGIVHDYRRAA